MIEASEQIWLKQVEFLTDRFAEVFRVSRWKYQDSLPKYTPHPKQYHGNLDYLVLVQPQKQGVLTLNHLLEILGSHSVTFGGADTRDWLGDPEKFQTPKIPYATWVNPQRGFLEPEFRLNEHPNNSNQTDYRKIRAGLQDNERGGTVLDAIFMTNHYPELFNEWGYQVNCPGTENRTGIYKLGVRARVRDEDSEIWKPAPYSRSEYHSGFGWSGGWGGTPNDQNTKWLVASRDIVTKP